MEQEKECISHKYVGIYFRKMSKDKKQEWSRIPNNMICNKCLKIIETK